MRQEPKLRGLAIAVKITKTANNAVVVCRNICFRWWQWWWWWLQEV